MLALQRSAGNAAVGRLLQRETAVADVEPVDPAAIFEDYVIRPGAKDSLERQVLRLPSGETYDRGWRTLTKQGLRDYLTVRQNGRLSAFDEQLISAWGQENSVALTAVLRTGDNRIFAYILRTGESGDRLRTVYAADGTVVFESRSERPLVNMGLGPIEWIMLASAAGSAALGLGRAALRHAAKRAAAKEAAKQAATGKIRLAENQLVLAVVQNGKIVGRPGFDPMIPHEDFVTTMTRWTKHTLPQGVEVVSIIKNGGEIFAILSKGVHGSALPASAGAQAAARALFH